MTTAFALVIISIVSAIICHFIAKRRGADAIFWGIMGMLIGPLAFPFALLSGPKE